MQEREIRLPSGWPFVVVYLLLLPGAVAALIVPAAAERQFLPYGLVSIVVFVIWLIGLPGFLVVYPNEARGIQLFGRYVGTVKNQRFYYCTPCYKADRVTLRVETFWSGQNKVGRASWRASCT